MNISKYCFYYTNMATPAGLEPATSRLEVSRSIQLSYGAFGNYLQETICHQSLRERSDLLWLQSVYNECQLIADILPPLLNYRRAQDEQAVNLTNRYISSVKLPRDEKSSNF